MQRLHERSDRVRLSADFARCEPAHPCSRKERCARYMATIPRGTPLADSSTPLTDSPSPMLAGARCFDYISVEELRLRSKARAAVPTKHPHWGRGGESASGEDGTPPAS